LDGNLLIVVVQNGSIDGSNLVRSQQNRFRELTFLDLSENTVAQTKVSVQLDTLIWVEQVNPLQQTNRKRMSGSLKV